MVTKILKSSKLGLSWIKLYEFFCWLLSMVAVSQVKSLGWWVKRFSAHRLRNVFENHLNRVAKSRDKSCAAEITNEQQKLTTKDVNVFSNDSTAVKQDDDENILEKNVHNLCLNDWEFLYGEMKKHIFTAEDIDDCR